ncbi:MAG: hypothetical protein R3F44_07685 [Candidatus Competibacteraceae bacterium]
MSRIETDRQPVAVTDLAATGALRAPDAAGSPVWQTTSARPRTAGALARRNTSDTIAWPGNTRVRVEGERGTRAAQASARYGESKRQTDVLRNWRDRVLMHYDHTAIYAGMVPRGIRSIPQTSHAVLVENGIGADQWSFFDDGLGDQ